MVIPAFNEEAALPDTLAELAAVRPDLDVVVVSDGSVDKTAALARAAGVHVIELPFNLGIGGALQAGFRYAERAGYRRGRSSSTPTASTIRASSRRSRPGSTRARAS